MVQEDRWWAWSWGVWIGRRG